LIKSKSKRKPTAGITRPASPVYSMMNVGAIRNTLEPKLRTFSTRETQHRMKHLDCASNQTYSSGIPRSRQKNVLVEYSAMGDIPMGKIIRSSDIAP